MPVLNWNERYSVNVRELDNQHRRLFDLINKLDDHMRAGKGREILGVVLRELVDYTKVHFANEERILRESGYPGYEEHKAVHAKVTERVNAIYRQYQEGKGDRLSIEALDYLYNWITKHIMGTDQRYASHLNSKGVE